MRNMSIGRKKTSARKIPFGSTVERFSSLGCHPNLEKRPGTHGYRNLFPGCHDWNKTPRIISKVPSWKRCLEVEEFSKRLGYHGDHIAKRRKWEKSVNGPGWHDISTLSSGRQIIFLKNVRFSNSKALGVAGPGTYGKNHVPYARKEEKSREKGFSFSVLMPFDGQMSRPKSLIPQPPYHLPPNIYKIQTFTEELVNKKISKRGPYDLFTGPRFQRVTVPKRLEKKDITPLRIDAIAWNHPKNGFKGKFMKCGKDTAITSRMILQDLATNIRANPGPSDYYPFPPEVVIASRYPFNSSVLEVRPYLKKELLPPPGRYNPDRKKRIKGDGLRSAFLSKSKRTLPIAPKLSWFE